MISECELFLNIYVSSEYLLGILPTADGEDTFLYFLWHTILAIILLYKVATLLLYKLPLQAYPAHLMRFINLVPGDLEFDCASTGPNSKDCC